MDPQHPLPSLLLFGLTALLAILLGWAALVGKPIRSKASLGKGDSRRQRQGPVATLEEVLLRQSLASEITNNTAANKNEETEVFLSLANAKDGKDKQISGTVPVVVRHDSGPRFALSLSSVATRLTSLVSNWLNSGKSRGDLARTPTGLGDDTEFTSAPAMHLMHCTHDLPGCVVLRSKLDAAASEYGADSEQRLATLASALRALGYLHYAFPSLPLHDLDYWRPAEKRPEGFLVDLADLGKEAVPPELVEVSFELFASGPLVVAARVRSRAARTRNQARKLAGDLVGNVRARAENVRARAEEVLRLPGTRPTSMSPPPAGRDRSPASSSSSSTLSPPRSTFSQSEVSDSESRTRSRSPQHLGLSVPTLLAILQRLTILLASQSGRTIKQGIEDPLVQLASGVSKRTKGDEVEKKKKELEDWVVASKLGLTPEILRANPSFDTFARANHLWRYLYIYSHPVPVSPDLTVSVMVQGEWLPWPRAESLIELAPGRGGVVQMKGRYSERGVVNQGFYEWKELDAFHKVRQEKPTAKKEHRRKVTEITEPSDGIAITRTPTITEEALPPWGNRYVLDICCLLHPLGPRINGDHAWLRLKSPLGEIISVGLYRPDNRGYYEWLRYPLKKRVGALQSPDISEYWGGQNIARVISVEITSDEAERIRQKIVADRDQGTVVYQVTHGNCVAFVLSYARLCGIEMPCRMALADIMAHGRSKWGWYVARGFSSLLGFLSGKLGKDEIEKALLDGEPDPEKRDMIKKAANDAWSSGLNGIYTAHPWMVGEIVRKEIENWREEQKKPLLVKLEGLEKQLEVVRTDIEVEWGIRASDKEGEESGNGNTAVELDEAPPSSQKRKSKRIEQATETNGTFPQLAPARSVGVLEEEIARCKEELDAIDYQLPEKYMVRKTVESS